VISPGDWRWHNRLLFGAGILVVAIRAAVAGPTRGHDLRPTLPLAPAGRPPHNPGMRWLKSSGHSSAVLLWAFRVWAQFGTEPVESGWVATATLAACDAAQRSFIDVARAYGTTVDLGDCREMSADDLQRPSLVTDPSDTPSAADYYRVPRGTASRGPRPTVR